MGYFAIMLVPLFDGRDVVMTPLVRAQSVMRPAFYSHSADLVNMFDVWKHGCCLLPTFSSPTSCVLWVTIRRFEKLN